MSDKKNFSVLGKIDGKFVEEADAYSVLPEEENRRGRYASDEKTARRKSRSRRFTKGAGIAACFLVFIALGIFIGTQVFSLKDGSSANMAAGENDGTGDYMPDKDASDVGAEDPASPSSGDGTCDDSCSGNESEGDSDREGEGDSGEEGKEESGEEGSADEEGGEEEDSLFGEGSGGD